MEISEELVKEKGIENGDVVKVILKCGYIKIKVVVIKCVCLIDVDGKCIYIVGILIYGGFVIVGKKLFLVNMFIGCVGDVNM